MDITMYQGPDMFREAANQKVSPDYPVSGLLFGVLFLVAIAAGIVVSIITGNLLLGGIILVGLIMFSILLMILLGRRQKKLQERRIEEFVRNES